MRLPALFTCCLALLLCCSRPASAADSGDKKKVVFIAGGPSHGFGAHDHLAGMTLLAHRLKQSMPGYESVVSQGWPKDEAAAFDGASAVVIFADGGPAHLALKHIRTLDKLSGKGVGIGCIHYACEVPADEGGEWWLKWMGGYFETDWSVNPHWTANFTKLPAHDVAKGVRPFTTHDEWYYNMRFRDGMEGVTPILSAVPPDETRQKKDGPHSGNPEVRKGIGKNQPEHVMWVSQNENGSRGFGTTGAHFHINWAQDDWRKSVLNAVVWIAKGEVPANGVESKRPTVDEMLQNHDEKVPENFDKDAMAKKIEEMNKAKDAAAK